MHACFAESVSGRYHAVTRESATEEHFMYIAYVGKMLKVFPVLKCFPCMINAVEELLIDVYYYLDKSSKRKQEIQQFQELCGVKMRKIVKH